MTIIVDTCVIIDALQNREPFAEDAIKLCLAVANQKCDAFDCRNAFVSPMSDFEDAMLAETAYRNNVDFIVTRNLKDFVKFAFRQRFLRKCLLND